MRALHFVFPPDLVIPTLDLGPGTLDSVPSCPVPSLQPNLAPFTRGASAMSIPSRLRSLSKESVRTGLWSAVSRCPPKTTAGLFRIVKTGPDTGPLSGDPDLGLWTRDLGLASAPARPVPFPVAARHDSAAAESGRTPRAPPENDILDPTTPNPARRPQFLRAQKQSWKLFAGELGESSPMVLFYNAV